MIKERILVIILLLHFLSLMLGSVLVLMLPLVVECTPDLFFFSSRRRHTRSDRDWSSDVCSSDLLPAHVYQLEDGARPRRRELRGDEARRADSPLQPADGRAHGRSGVPRRRGEQDRKSVV